MRWFQEEESWGGGELGRRSSEAARHASSRAHG